MAMADELGVGVIGLGVRGQHAYYAGLAAQPGVRVIRMAPHPLTSPVLLEGRGEEFFRREAKKFGARLCHDPEEVIGAEDVDIVCVLVEPSLAFGVIRRCAEAGKHILRDKPMVLTAREADATVGLVERAGVKMTVCWGAWRYSPKCVEMKKAVDAGTVGSVAVVDFLAPWAGGPLVGFRCSREHHERYGGGELHNFGGYALMFLRWLLGRQKPLRRVWAQVGTFFYPDYVEAGNEDMANLALEYEGGVVANVLTGRLPAPCGRLLELRIAGTKGELAARDFRTGGMGELVRDFVTAIRKDSRPPIDHRDGRAIRRALLAAYESARVGRATELPPL